MDFGKKLAADAGTFLSRAKQYTEEKLGHAEKTELDAHFENLLQRADKTKMWTEKLLSQTESVLQPNPNVRLEEFMLDKLDKKRRDRQTNSEILGQFMLTAGNDFGPGTSYGSALVKCGQTEQKLGQAERDYIQATANNFLQPLNAFLEGDMKTVQKERKILDLKRLDLDAAKNKLRRAKSQNSKDQPPEPSLTLEDDLVSKAETELRVAQGEFDRQSEITKLLLEGISSAHAHHLRCLHDFVEAQLTYYSQCQQYMTDLQKQLGSFSVGARNPVGGHSNGGSISPNITTGPPPPAGSIAGGTAIPTAPPPSELSDTRPGSDAKVLYDYDAADASELSLKADEIIRVYRVDGMETDWMMGERGAQKGKVPITYIELL